jgi:hypothetical protein
MRERVVAEDRAGVYPLLEQRDARIDFVGDLEFRFSDEGCGGCLLSF